MDSGDKKNYKGVHGEGRADRISLGGGSLIISFGSENPELWDEICKRGIVYKVFAKLNEDGFDNEDYDYVDEDTADSVVEVVESLYEIPEIRDCLVEWAAKEIHREESDYYGSKVDESEVKLGNR